VVTTDGTGVVSHAGTVLLAELADRIRLTAALSEATDGLRERRSGHDPGRVLVDVAEEVRAYAFLGQVVPFADPHLEELYYYGKYLLTKLPTRDAGGCCRTRQMTMTATRSLRTSLTGLGLGERPLVISVSPSSSSCRTIAGMARPAGAGSVAAQRGQELAARDHRDDLPGRSDRPE
jgi:hypothetical protein